MSATIWLITIAVIVALLAFDYFFHVRKAHIPTIKEAAVWSALYVGFALLFGVVLLVFGGQQMGVEYFAGYLTEKALSVDNLFVFLILIASFKVPRADQQKVLLFGIVFSLIARTAFIFIGAAALERFAALFYIFGIFLIFTAGKLVTDDSEEDGDNIAVRTAKKVIPSTDHFDGDKMFTHIDGKRVMTPMLLVMVAIGGTDIMFAFDSIPAIFGITQDTYIVFTAVTFSLLGLRQLYFLLDGLLDRLVFLNIGLAIILGFIGIKLILHALHENNIPFINDGEPVHVWEVPTELSLAVIVVVIVLVVITSLYTPVGKRMTRQNSVLKHAKEVLHDEDDQEAAEKHHALMNSAYKELHEGEETPQIREYLDHVAYRMEHGVNPSKEKAAEIRANNADD
ncbi:TerC family protein [Dietzia sp.]|uniref:TerC family protein n=1 Tax=Dietzia sp. TaxID=1871616 RepID=UPI002FDA9E2E